MKYWLLLLFLAGCTAAVVVTIECEGKCKVEVDRNLDFVP